MAQLIAYKRPDRSDQRESRYRIVEVEHAEELKAALSDALGVKAVVVKQRRLFLRDEVRIHLDSVEGLGRFIELEAVAPAHSDLSREEAQIRTLRKAFALTDADLVSVSYCDLLLAGETQISG